MELTMIAITPYHSEPLHHLISSASNWLAGEAENKTLIGGVHRGELEWYTRVATPDI